MSTMLFWFLLHDLAASSLPLPSIGRTFTCYTERIKTKREKRGQKIVAVSVGGTKEDESVGPCQYIVI
jgi:hypothetical protein